MADLVLTRLRRWRRRGSEPAIDMHVHVDHPEDVRTTVGIADSQRARLVRLARILGAEATPLGALLLVLFLVSACRSGGGGERAGMGGTGHSILGDGQADPVGAGRDGSLGTPPRSWTCPPGPFDPPQAGPSQPVCQGFPFKYDWNEGPTWIASHRAFFFSNFVVGAAGPGDMIEFTPETGTCETFIADDGCNGLAVAPDGNIIAACQTPRAVMHYDVTTKQGTVLADMADGQMLDSVNDLVAHSNGTIYFTNPVYELAGRPLGIGQAVLRLDPGGAISVIATGSVNGIALSPDEARLYVVFQGVWDLDADGVPSNPRSFPLGGDGIAVDCAGNIYDNTGTIRDPQGNPIGTFPVGTNMAFGGPDGKTLFVVGGTMAQIVPMNIPGLP